MSIKNKTILITGGAGFIGTNTALRFAPNNKVIIIDNLLHKGASWNLRYLLDNYDIKFYKIDLQNRDKICDFLSSNRKIDIIIHLAGQVAVTSSIIDPYGDFMNNALATINILDSLRSLKLKPITIFSSTNKVYGNLADMKLTEKATRYVFKNTKISSIDENRNLDFHSPYGCSKGAADQYIHDFSRIYGIPTVVFRQSCIYGEFQIGAEDQGWLAWLMSASLLKKEITIFGTGKQVRDVLYIKDLVEAYDLCITNIDKTAGKIFNIGGGINNTISILEYLYLIENTYKLKIKYKHGKQRAGDQLIYISNTGKFSELTGWTPLTDYKSGIDRLYLWLKNHLKMTKKLIEI